jgi:hypothetical protein
VVDQAFQPEVRLERQDFAEDAFYLGQEKQVPWAGGALCPIAYIRDVKVLIV